MNTESDSSFVGLIQKVESGSEQAAAQLIATYGPSLRRLARIRLQGSDIRRVIDSQDIYQSVMAVFFQRVQTGELELKEPQDLIRLVSTMIRNRITDKVRRLHAQRRDMRRNISMQQESILVVDSDDSPSALVSRKELMERFRSLLSDEERQLLDARAQGYEWKEIAQRQSATPDKLRKQLKRAMDKVTELLSHMGPDS